MPSNAACTQFILVMLLAASMPGCDHVQGEPTELPAQDGSETAPGTSSLPTTLTQATVTPHISPAPDLSAYAFPGSIDPANKYLFYLHGRIIEDQGLPAISPEYGEYEYVKILEALAGYGFVIISEQRPKDTDGMAYSEVIAGQVRRLLDAGVPPGGITVVGASKGGGIAIYVSHILKNEDINYVLMAICHPDTVKELIQEQVVLHGNVLSIYDSVDDLAGSCQGLFSFSQGKGISSYDEVVLNIGTGHGILYQPLEGWITPLVQWAEKP